MKKGIFCLSLFLCAFYASGQMVEGSRVWTSTLSDVSIYYGKTKVSSDVTPSDITKGSGFQLSPELTFGKIKNKSLLLYGLSFIYAMNKQPNISRRHTYGFAPVVCYQRFYTISDKLYFTPFSRFSIGYQSTKEESSFSSSELLANTIAGKLDFHPFSLSLGVTQKTNFIFTIGIVSVNYDRIKSFRKPVIANSKSISTNIALNGYLNRIGFGIQKTF